VTVEKLFVLYNEGNGFGLVLAEVQYVRWGRLDHWKWVLFNILCGRKLRQARWLMTAGERWSRKIGRWSRVFGNRGPAGAAGWMNLDHLFLKVFVYARETAVVWNVTGAIAEAGENDIKENSLAGKPC
jgi:hypothetical protein